MSKFFPLKLSGVSSFHVAYLSVLWLICLSANHLKAQDVPNAINYQAIVRDSETFQPISDQGAYVSVEFLDGPDGDVLYQEEFPSIQTGKAGLLNLSLGQGDPVINSFGSIAWDSGNVWLRLSVDIGNGLNILQETPFNTVPYAFYAKTSGGSDDDSDPTNELIQSISLDVSDLEIVEGDQITTVDLSSLIDDNDSDPTNERIDSLRYNAVESVLSVFESGSQFDVELGIPEIEPGSIQDLSLSEDDVLTITNNEDATPIDLTPYLDNTDIQTLSLNNTILRISGSESEVDLADLPNLGTDDDSDPSNELQELNFEGNMLSISNSPSNSQIDLSTYLDNTDNQIMTLDGTILTLTGDPNPIDLSELPNTGTDADADPLNEIQDLELVGTELSITNNPSAAVIDLSLFNTDNQDLTLSGTTLILSGDGTTVELNALPGLGDDADANPSNEIQTIESSDGSITVTPNGNDYDLSVSATDGSETIVN
ncbi:MAG TPA: hypothetical protein VJ894_04530, partial [Cryomorphaceae bacterium]|nr:hypothetical protein [Cryomorphaceae bacterium]